MATVSVLLLVALALASLFGGAVTLKLTRRHAPEKPGADEGDALLPPTAAPAEPRPTTLPDGARPLRDGCVHDELLSDGSMVLYNGCRHQMLTLNPTGVFVWEYCDGQFDVDTIIAELRGVFPEATSVDVDVRQTLDALAQAGMIGPAPVADVTEPSTVARR
jgi:hypothetical protein